MIRQLIQELRLQIREEGLKPVDRFRLFSVLRSEGSLAYDLALMNEIMIGIRAIQYDSQSYELRWCLSSLVNLALDGMNDFLTGFSVRDHCSEVQSYFGHVDTLANVAYTEMPTYRSLCLVPLAVYSMASMVHCKGFWGGLETANDLRSVSPEQFDPAEYLCEIFSDINATNAAVLGNPHSELRARFWFRLLDQIEIRHDFNAVMLRREIQELRRQNDRP